MTDVTDDECRYCKAGICAACGGKRITELEQQLADKERENDDLRDACIQKQEIIESTKGMAQLWGAAEVELEQARVYLRRYRNETPPKNSPHMICHLVDEFLEKADD